MTAIALDDERPALDIIQAFCARSGLVQLVGVFTRVGEARAYLDRNPVDLVFLDINMPHESGLSVARSVPPRTLVIFTTAYSEFAAESYEIDTVDYLLKPFSFERFEKSVQRAQARWQACQLPASEGPNAEPIATDPDYLYLRVDYGLVKITIAAIRFIEGLDNYLKIHRIADKPLVVRLTMKAMLAKLPASQFVRVHRSYIVAYDKIQAVRNKTILTGNDELPIGSSYKAHFFGRFGRQATPALPGKPGAGLARSPPLSGSLPQSGAFL